MRDNLSDFPFERFLPLEKDGGRLFESFGPNGDSVVLHLRKRFHERRFQFGREPFEGADFR